MGTPLALGMGTLGWLDPVITASFIREPLKELDIILDIFWKSDYYFPLLIVD